MYTEETASPGLWKSGILTVMAVALIAAAFVVPPGTRVMYTNWFIGLIAANTAIAFAGNLKWERLLAGTAAIWLFMSGFVPSLLSGPWMPWHEVGIGIVLLLAAVSAYLHLRDEIRRDRPLTM